MGDMLNEMFGQMFHGGGGMPQGMGAFESGGRGAGGGRACGRNTVLLVWIDSLALMPDCLTPLSFSFGFPS